MPLPLKEVRSVSIRTDSQFECDSSELQAETVFNSASSKPVIGSLIGVNDSGEPLVSFSEETRNAPQIALNALSTEDVTSIQSFPVKVMINFESDNGQAVISGLVKSTLFSMDVLARQNDTSNHGAIDKSQESVEQSTKILSNKPNTLYTEIDGKKIILTGEKEILLKCGKSSILMRRDGKIVIKGDNITSRSSSASKIKGSSVSIN